MPRLDNIEKIRKVEWSRRYLWDIYFSENIDVASIVGQANTAVGRAVQGALNSVKNEFLGNPVLLPKSGADFEWFPITKFTDEEVSVTNFEVPGTYYNYAIPKGGKVLGINFTFIDDIENSMFIWAKNWMNPFNTVASEGLLKSVATSETSVVTDAGGNLLTERTGLKTKYIKTLSEMVKQITISKLDNQLNTVTTNSYLVIPDGTLSFSGDSEDGLHTYDMRLIKVAELDVDKIGPDATPRFDIVGKKTAGVLRKIT